VKELAARWRGAPAIITEEFTTSMTRIVLQGERISKQKAPKWRGQLRQSIHHQVTPASGAVTGEWGTALTYAKWKEKGTEKKNYFVPWKYIGAWAVQHGFTAPKNGKGGIRVTGNPQPFIKPAYEEIKPKVGPEFQRAVKRVIARLKAR
jgi:HK97 gp10 family phage protein